MDNHYNPFDKQIGEITFDDLNLLIENEVTEGYYIEYKSDFQETKKIAKSIASFANTYGGWYFIGIEDEEGTNIAKSIVGFDFNKHNQPKESIRQIAREHIHPIPYFDTKLLRGENGKYVLIVFIPESFETPHIVGGVVYIRNGEESSPVKNDNKHTLDRLYQKSMLLKEKVDVFLKNPFTSSIGESENGGPSINIYLLPRNFMTSRVENFLENSFLDELMEIVSQQESLVEDNNALLYSIPFKNVVRTPNSIVFRDTTNGLNIHNFTLEFFANGAGRIRIPIPSFMPQMPYKNKFIKALSNKLDEHLSSYRLVNLAEVLMAIRFAVKKYSRFRHHIKSNDSTMAIFEMINILGLIPFVESKSFLEHIEKYGVPISMYKYSKIPGELSLDKWIELEDLDSIHFDINEIFLMTLGLSIDTKMLWDSIKSYIDTIELNRGAD